DLPPSCRHGPGRGSHVPRCGGIASAAASRCFPGVAVLPIGCLPGSDGFLRCPHFAVTGSQQLRPALRGIGNRPGGPRTVPASTPHPPTVAASHRGTHAALPGWSLPAALVGLPDGESRVPAVLDVAVKPVARYT